MDCKHLNIVFIEKNVKRTNEITKKVCDCCGYIITTIEPIKEPTCRHDWECLRDRVHNKGNGKGKYMAYKCRKCKKFQRRKY